LGIGKTRAQPQICSKPLVIARAPSSAVRLGATSYGQAVLAAHYYFYHRSMLDLTRDAAMATPFIQRFPNSA